MAESPDPSEPVKPWMLGLSAGMAAGSTLIGIMLIVYGPGFDRLYENSGVDLPALTRVALDYVSLAIVPAIVGALAFARLWLRRESGAAIAVSTLAWTGTALVVSIAMVIVWFVAMYLPIFRMGGVMD